MRHFQVLVFTLLTAITLELGWIAVKLPTPVAQAALPPSAPMVEDPHDTLKRQVAVLQQQIEKVLYRLNDDSKRLLMTCVNVNHVFEVVNAGLPGHSGLSARGDIETCTAKGWRAQSWNNFDIPFGP